MGALLVDASAADYKDTVGVPDRREMVRDDEAGLVLHEGSHGGLDLPLRAGVAYRCVQLCLLSAGWLLCRLFA